MRIKALVTFISGRFSAKAGEEIEVFPDVAKKLIAVGFAEVAEKPKAVKKGVKNGTAKD